MVAWSTDREWAWCAKCQGLWSASIRHNGEGGVCPAGGGHIASGSGIYSLVRNANPTPANHQPDWRKCTKCMGLFFGGHLADSRCPADHSIHTSDGANFALAHGSGAGQIDWCWCHKCQGLFFGEHQTTSVCPRDNSTHSFEGTGNYHLPIVTRGIYVHTKTLSAPDVPFTTLFQNMREVYATAGIDVQWRSDETLNLPDLDILDVGNCQPSALTSEQLSLFSHRNNVGGATIAVYAVFATSPFFNGCAAFPAGKPSAVIIEQGSPWTLAHEVGHVLGLPHCDSVGARLPNRLMTGGGTDFIDNPPPDLVPAEMTKMYASPSIFALKPY